MMRRGGRGGFTLLEILVALTIAGTAVLLAHQVFATAARGAESLRSARRELDTASNGRRWLASAIGSIEVGRDGDVPFDGGPHAATFSTYLLSERGWFERGVVTLEVSDSGLHARASRRTVILATGVSALDMDYLLEPGLDSKWVSRWASPVSAPLALRLRLAFGGRVDTMLFLVGPRG